MASLCPVNQNGGAEAAASAPPFAGIGADLTPPTDLTSKLFVTAITIKRNTV